MCIRDSTWLLVVAEAYVFGGGIGGRTHYIGSGLPYKTLGSNPTCCTPKFSLRCIWPACNTTGQPHGQPTQKASP
eukprot:2179001-Pyramimonas_sp.AAC.1